MGFLDIDLVVSPVHILEMYQAIVLGGADLAVARRVYRTSLHPSSMLRDALSYGYRFLARSYLLLDFEDTEAGYKFFERSAYDRLAPVCRNSGWFWDTELIAQATMRGMKLRAIPCLYQRSRDKVSTVRPLRDSWEYLCQLVRFRHRNGIALAAARKRRKEKHAAGAAGSSEQWKTCSGGARNAFRQITTGIVHERQDRPDDQRLLRRGPEQRA